jgi:hypothetical protein
MIFLELMSLGHGENKVLDNYLVKEGTSKTQ